MSINLDLPYTLNFMLGAMTNREKLEASLYASGIDSANIIMDIDILIEEAKLTKKQAEVVRLYYYNQMTQEEVSKVLGISQQAVLDHLNKIKDKLAKVVERWEKLDESKFNNK